MTKENESSNKEITFSREELYEIKDDALKVKKTLNDNAWGFASCLEILRNWPHEMKTVHIFLGNCMSLKCNMSRLHPELSDAFVLMYRATVRDGLDIIKEGHHLSEESPRRRKLYEMLFCMEIDDETGEEETK